MGAAISCEVCRKQITDSGVWRFGQCAYICVHCYDQRKHTDFVLDSTQLIINDENNRRLDAEREIHRLLPTEIHAAQTARRNFRYYP